MKALTIKTDYMGLLDELSTGSGELSDTSIRNDDILHPF